MMTLFLALAIGQDFTVSPGFTVRAAEKPIVNVKPAPLPGPNHAWKELENGDYGLYLGSEFVGRYFVSLGVYRRYLGPSRAGNNQRFEAAPSRPPIDLPETLPVPPVERKGGLPSAAPFSVSGAGAATADDSEDAGRWLAYLPDGFEPYKPAEYSQRVVILNGQDDLRLMHWRQDDISVNDYKANPNRFEPYHQPGGLVGLQGWRSKLAVLIPSGRAIRVFRERIEAGASRLLPRWGWRFPDGTVFADVLTNQAGEPFEIRLREKEAGRWHSKLYLSDLAKAPKGYRGVKVGECVDCHKDAGAQKQYGIGTRGADEAFSFTPFVDGTFQLDRRWPIAE